MRVKRPEEIATTLAEDGTLEGLPFMPEMARFSGAVFRVRASAHKTCCFAGTGGIDAALLLDGVRCDGSAHGGCESRCPIFWKDAWVEPVEKGEIPTRAESAAGLERKAACSLFVRGRDPARGTYSCQSTELDQATLPLPFWSVRQYWDDVRSGNVTLHELVRGLPVMLFNKFQVVSRHVLPARLRVRGGRTYPNVVGTLTKTPDVRLGLEPGDPVKISSQAEIVDTLDILGRNRGLTFIRDMVPYCDGRSLVHHRVETRIDELTGKLERIANPCLVLDGVVCRGRYNRFCPRELDCWWREAWLSRVESSARVMPAAPSS